MQVTHVQDHVTHAVIGANTAKSFGISDSAEFFNILSNTLYSDKILAVVREVLCNAWDAHIITGRTDTPIEVTLDHGSLTIRDRGPGISKEDMHPRYCVYGNSTKLNDGMQTGGFGLGCKAPFAYTDHFEVTSHHAGTRTIYRVSKSSGEVGGRPGMTEIVSTPTKETGIQVKIEIRDHRDVKKFEDMIQQIASAGEMNVSYNTKILETLPFSQAKHGFLMTRKAVTTQANNNRTIYVRYGNVIYPIDSHDAYAKAHSNISSMLSRLPKNYYDSAWRLVLQAKPNTISVTPSRESLSMTDYTVETLKGLLEGFLKLLSDQVEGQALRIAQERIEQAILDIQPAQLLTTTHVMYRISAATFTEQVLVDPAEIARAQVAAAYPTAKDFRKKDVVMRLQALIQTGFGNRGQLQSYLKAYLKGDDTWFHRRLVAPLVLGLKADPELTPSRLMAYGVNDGKDTQRRFSYAEIAFTEATKFSKKSLENYLPYLRNLIILTYNRADLVDRAPYFPMMRHRFGNTNESLVYIVQRSDRKAAAARAFFNAQGFTVLDLTQRQKWEEPVAPVAADDRDRTPRKKGLTKLSYLLADPTASYISSSRIHDEEAERIEDPEFYVKIPARNDTQVFEIFGPVESRDITRLFGSKGGVVINDAQGDKYRALGAKPLITWLLEKVIQEMKTNTRIHDYMAVDINRAECHIGWPMSRVLSLISGDDALRVHYDIDHKLTPDDRAYLRLWASLSGHTQLRMMDEVKAVSKFLEGFPPSTSLLKLVSSVKSSELIKIVELDKLNIVLNKSIVRGNNQQNTILNQQKARARDLLIFALKG